MRNRVVLLSGALTLFLVLPLFAAGPPEGRGNGNGPPVAVGAELVETIVPFSFDGDLRKLPKAPGWHPGMPIKEIPRRHYQDPLPPASPPRFESDPLLPVQAQAPAPTERLFGIPMNRVNGQGYTGVNPPDPAGDVGTQYYIQAINGSGGAVFRVYNKATFATVAGPTAMDSLGSGNCASGAGDPIVLYDQLAGRWLMSEFSSSGNRLCVYVSKTGNPVTGGWYNYDFTAPNFPDYPKYGVWPDAYYVGTNESGGPAVYALERSKMLTGTAAGMQRFTATSLSGFGFQMVTPADADGSAPPAGTPGYFIRHKDSGAHGGTGDYLEVFQFSVNWASPASSTFTGPTQIAVSSFDSALCGLTSFSCIAQPGTTTKLDPLREVVMFRAQYRNFGSYQTLVGSLATDVGSDRAGVRWFELRRTTGNWSLYQEGTYAPGSDSRWMSSTAMDGNGNIATAYNISSSSTYPGLRYAGRLAADPLGTLPQGEFTLVNGTSRNASNRYGDYSALNVDPVDDCTFFFTGQYNTSTSWSTWIDSFAFGGCGGGGPVCGNNTKETGETCDGTDLGGQTCVSQGYTGGTLACNGSCSGFDTSGCTTGGGNVLTNGVPVTGLAATTGNQLNYTMSVPAGATNLVFTTTGSDPDADLYVKFGSAPTTSSYDCRSWSSSSNETCNIGTAQAGTYYVMVNAYSSFTGLTLQGSYTDPGSCSSPASQQFTSISGGTGSETRYTFNVPACANSATFQISGGTGDADLYVRFGSAPTTTTYNCRPYLNGNNETCTFNPSSTGTYHVMLRGYTSYSGVTLTMSHSP